MPSTKTKAPAGTKIGWNEYQYNLQEEYQLKLIEAFNELELIANTTLGLDKISNYASFIQAPANYILLLYTDLVSSFYPPNTDMQRAYQLNTGVALKQINESAAKFWKYHKLMQKHAPLINAKGLKFQLKADAFNIYLNEDKREHFECLQRFIKASEDLMQFDGNGIINIVRFSPSLQMNGLQVIPNMSKFR